LHGGAARRANGKDGASELPEADEGGSASASNHIALTLPSPASGRGEMAVEIRATPSFY